MCIVVDWNIGEILIEISVDFTFHLKSKHILFSFACWKQDFIYNFVESTFIKFYNDMIVDIFDKVVS